MATIYGMAQHPSSLCQLLPSLVQPALVGSARLRRT